MITYRQTRTGEWVAYGPASEITAGQYVEIGKRNGGTDRRMVTKVGKSFQANGQSVCYGYLGSGATVAGPTRSAGGAWWDSPRQRRMAAADGDPSAMQD